MKFLAIEKEIKPVDWSAEAELLKEEALQVYRLYREGTLRGIWFNETHQAVLMLECPDPEQAGGLIASLPLVKKGLIGFTVMQLSPYTGFERLMK